jgi:cyclin B
MGKQKDVAAGRTDAMNRRAPLGDIGNFVSVRAAEGYEQNHALFYLEATVCLPVLLLRTTSFLVAGSRSRRSRSTAAPSRGASLLN